jgi:hypothetical protein
VAAARTLSETSTFIARGTLLTGVHAFSKCNLTYLGGTRLGSWLRHYATSKKVAGSSPDKVDFFNLPDPSSRTMAPGSTQSLTEMSTRNLPGGKGRLARKADNLTTICNPNV